MRAAVIAIALFAAACGRAWPEGLGVLDTCARVLKEMVEKRSADVESTTMNFGVTRS